MHHKFVLIDAEPSVDTSGSDSETEEEEEEEVEVCDKCSGSVDSEANSAVSTCIKCSDLKLRSVLDVIKFPSDRIPRLPKHGLLLTGSLNWTMQVNRVEQE